MHATLPKAAAEFHDADLGDRRLNKRLSSIVDRLAVSPGQSFPKMVPSVAEREAFYRFVENPRIRWEDILAPHEHATARRCEGQSVVRVAHDTSWFAFDGEREGLGPIGSRSRPEFGPRGFAGHFSLAVADGEHRAVLGVLAASTFVRSDGPIARTKEARKQKKLESRRTSREHRESARWMVGVRAAEERLGPGVVCIHVADQEADDFTIFADLIAESRRFVIRGSVGRRIARSECKHVDEALDEVMAHVFRRVPVTARFKPRSGRASRGERMAELHIHATTVVLAKPPHATHECKAVTINVVHVFEPKPPNGEEPVDWTLYTTEPIKTAEDLAAIVDHYRARWRIEEFFKAVKTGCAYEKRQLMTYDALRRALALLVPMAWHLLAIRSIAREAGERPASDLVDRVQVDVLRALSPASKLPSNPSARDVMRAIADLGGHVRQNGEPGWLVLGRGYQTFAQAEMVWRAAAAHALRSDQS
jgi:IS4 transposase